MAITLENPTYTSRGVYRNSDGKWDVFVMPRETSGDVGGCSACGCVRDVKHSNVCSTCLKSAKKWGRPEKKYANIVLTPELVKKCEDISVHLLVKLLRENLSGKTIGELVHMMDMTQHELEKVIDRTKGVACSYYKQSRAINRVWLE